MKNWLIKKENILVFFITYIVLQFGGTAGPYLEGDAMQYVSMGGALPPFYPLFLHVFRLLFGVDYYLSIVVIFQCLFASLVITLLVWELKNSFALPFGMGMLLMIALWIPYIRESMRTAPRFMISHWILTEGMGISIFYLFMWFSFKVICEKTYKAFAGVSVCTFILLLVRSQFMVCLPLDILLLGYVVWQKKGGRWLTILLGIFMIGIAYLLSGKVEDAYKTARTGTTQNAWNSSYFLLHLLYSSDAEDVEIFEEQEQKEVFSLVYPMFQEEHYVYSLADGSMYEKGWHWSYHFSENNRAMKALIEEYVTNELGITDEVERTEYITRLVKGMIKPLFKKNGMRCIAYSLYQLPTSMTYYVFLLKDNYIDICMLMAAVIYVITIVLLWKQIRKDSGSLIIWMMLYVMAFMVGNALVCDFALHTMVRYMLYAMGIFYALLLILVEEYVRERWQRK